MLVASAELVASCKRHEGGPVLAAYADPDSPQAVAKREGHAGWERLSGAPWTLGYGRTTDVHQGSTCTLAQANAWVVSDCTLAVNQLANNLPWSINLCPARFDVLAEMAFNMGIAGLLKFHRALTYIQDGKYGVACDDLQYHTEWPKQVGHRAVDLEKQLMSGKYA